MKMLNVFLALLVSLLIGFGIFEGGLRLTSFAPTDTGNQFDEDLGWSKVPSTTVSRSSAEFEFDLVINEQGLRDDPMASTAKPDGRFRVITLGDSFTLGYTVPREELFVDILENWWLDEERNIDVINAGMEGYATDQEVRWLQENGDDYAPDLVLLFPYENDIFWNGQANYLRYPKPQYTPEGVAESTPLEDPGPRKWSQNWAIPKALTALSGWIKGPSGPMFFTPEGGTKPVLREFSPLLDTQPEFLGDAVARTRGSLIALKKKCAEMGARLVVVPIPSKASIYKSDRKRLGTKTLGIGSEGWSADAPVDLFIQQATELKIETLDPRSSFRGRMDAGADLYYKVDWHLNENGNRALAQFLHDKLSSPAMNLGLGNTPTTKKIVDIPPSQSSSGVPTWAFVYLALLVFLSITYKMHYGEEAVPMVMLQIGGMLALIFTLFLGAGKLTLLLPPEYAGILLAAVFFGLFGFILYKLGRRISTILELVQAFVSRGHWYLLPLLVVLLSIGSLLVVAASSPFVAPFIYTLF
jgi:hypothetical protein